MKKTIYGNCHPSMTGGFMLLLSILLLGTGCQKLKDIIFPQNPSDNNYEQVNIVADNSSFGAMNVDPLLVNPWGLTTAPSGPFWPANNGSGTSTVYDKAGNTLIPAVTIPAHVSGEKGSPTGVVFNGTTDFVIPANQRPARFIFASLDGVISAWNGGTEAMIVADRNERHAAYTGLAIGAVGEKNYIYAANFSADRIDVFNKDFAPVTMSFKDPNMPKGYVPFNIQNINGKLYVTYALKGTEEEVKGVGLGFVSVFNTDGTFVKRFASRGTLNAPWGVAIAPLGFGQGENAILIGNFGDGKINVYDSKGHFKEQLHDQGHVISIDGLWAISFIANTPATDPLNLYFTAGPNDETHGIFGYLRKY